MYKYFKHESDLGIIGEGKTIEKAFESGAKAAFSYMTDISKIKPETKLEISCSEEDDDNLFVEWLNTLLEEARMRKLVFKRFVVKRISHSRLTAVVYGSKINKATKLKAKIIRAIHGMSEVGKKGKNIFAKCLVEVKK